MIDDAKTTQFIGKLPGDLGGAFRVPMARMGGYPERWRAPLPGARNGARVSPSPEGTMLRIIFGLTMILAIGGPASRAYAQDPTARCVSVGNEQMTIASAQGRGLAIENFSEVETAKFLTAFNAMAQQATSSRRRSSQPSAATGFTFSSRVTKTSARPLLRCPQTATRRLPRRRAATACRRLGGARSRGRGFGVVWVFLPHSRRVIAGPS